MKKLTIIALTIVILAVVGCGKLPSDQEMKLHFQEHKELFDSFAKTLTTELTANQFVSGQAVPNRSWPDEYLEKIMILDVVSGVRQADGPCTVLFLVAADNLTNKYKGYAYCPGQPSPQFESLEEIPNGELPDKTHAYLKIDENWYIYYWWT